MSKTLKRRPAETSTALVGFVTTLIAVFTGDTEWRDAVPILVGLVPALITWYVDHGRPHRNEQGSIDIGSLLIGLILGAVLVIIFR